MSESRYQYLFGPVPSRRLGRSLGVDITPLKTCTQNCIYCQLCKDAPQVIERKEYVRIEAVLEELERKIESGLEADYVTISGSGEPTLHSRLGDLIDGIRKLTDIPVAVITNGTLLSDPGVRRDCCKADVVLPSLDAGDAKTFEAMNHPHPDLSFEAFVDGLARFREIYEGPIWLEVFFCEGINTDPASILHIREIIRKIRPNKVQINTSVRPVVHPEARRVEREKLDSIARQLGEYVEVIADFSKQVKTSVLQADMDAILEMLRRRPCSLDDISNGLGIHTTIIQKSLQLLLNTEKIVSEEKNHITYYRIP